MTGNSLAVIADTLTQHADNFATIGQEAVKIFEVRFQAISALGKLRISNEERANILNQQKIPANNGLWNGNSVTNFAREHSIRLTPLSAKQYSQHQKKIAEQHAFLEIILDAVRAGNTSLYAIKLSLIQKYANGDYDTKVIPGTGTISRILKYCRNDSPGLAKKIDAAFAEGEANNSTPTRSKVATFLKHIAGMQPSGAN